MDKRIKRLPAEWEAQSFTQFTFPHRDSDWATTFEEVVACFVNCIDAIVAFQPVLVVCAKIDEVKNYLSHLDQSKIDYVELPSNDTWARDHGGITIEENGRLMLIDFKFNGWGLKFPANFDNLLIRRLWELNKFQNADFFSKNFVLEGGSIESDGAGTLLTTSECLLSPNRNPEFNKVEIEAHLKDFFGLKRVLWLDHGALEGDDTNAHIDTLARFCDEKTIAYVQCQDERDSHFNSLQKMEQQLRQFRTLSGDPYRLLPLPMPQAIYDEDGQRLPATYANFLFVNNGLIVPTYGVPQDEEALHIFKLLFPKRKVVGVNCRALIVQHGSLHCITMQYSQGV
ncbi:MAG: agmatine deiminase family protein [Bacteroidota bacterium]